MKLLEQEVKDTVKRVQYYRFPDTTTTVCALTLTNGFIVTGESACIDPNEFNTSLGEQFAYDNALQKVFHVEAYMLKQRLFCFGK